LLHFFSFFSFFISSPNPLFSLPYLARDSRSQSLPTFLHTPPSPSSSPTSPTSITSLTHALTHSLTHGHDHRRDHLISAQQPRQRLHYLKPPAFQPHQSTHPRPSHLPSWPLGRAAEHMWAPVTCSSPSYSTLLPTAAVRKKRLDEGT